MASVSTDRRFGVNSGKAIKVPCRAATTANLTLSGEQTVDGVALVTGDRVLVKNQTTGANNGIYLVDTGVWTRTPDFDGTYDIVQGTLIPVAQGTVSAGQVYRITTANPLTIGTTSIAFDFALSSSTLSYTPISGTFAGIATTVQTWLDRLLTAAATTGAALIGFLQSGTGATSGNVQTELRALAVRPQQFGGVADGVTDCTAAIQAAQNTGKAVYFPNGTYIVAGTVTATSAIRWFGESASAAIVKKTGTGVLLSLAGTARVLDTEVCNMTFKGTVGAGQQVGIDLVNTVSFSQQGFKFSNVYFTDFVQSSTAKPANSAIVQADYSKAWYKTGTWAAFNVETDTPQINPLNASIAFRVNTQNWLIDLSGCYFDSCNIAIYANGSPCDYIKIHNGTSIQSCAVAGMFVSATGITIEECDIAFNYSGFWVFGGSLFKFKGLQMEGNELHNVYVGADGSGACRIVTSDTLKLQPKNGDPSTQVNSFYLVQSDSSYFSNVYHNGVTAVQTAEKGWDYFVTGSTNRVVADPIYEPSDGFVQINDLTVFARLNRKVAGTERFYFPASYLNLPGNIGTVAGDIAYDATNPRLKFYDGSASRNVPFILAKSAAAIATPADVTEDTLVTITVPANALGANGQLRITTFWTFTNNANAKTMRVRYSGAAGTVYFSRASTTAVSAEDTVYIANRNATNSQMGWGKTTDDAAVAATFGLKTSAVDTTASTTVVITGQKANSGDTLQLEGYMVEILH